MTRASHGRPRPRAVALLLGVGAAWGCGDEAGTGSGASSTSTESGSGGASTTGSTGGGGHAPAVCAPPSADPPPGFFVAVDGSAAGDGSFAAPWDLQTALLHPPALAPGDTVWLRGGTYAGAFYSKLVGTAAAPITVRSYPGEWAVLDGAGATSPGLEIYKSFTVFRDFEVTNGDPDRTVARPSGIYVEGEGMRLVHLVVHDVGTGVICNSATDSTPELAPDLEIYGSIFFNSGWQEGTDGHGHHLYLQNRDGTKHVVDNVIFDSFGFGVHAYSDDDTHWTQNYELAGNVWFGAGAAVSGPSKHFDDCMVGHNGQKPVAGLVLRQNMGWATGLAERGVRLGWSAPNDDVTLQDNYLVGQTIFQPSWQSVAMTGNTFVGEVVGVDPAGYPGNEVLTSAPNDNRVFVRPSTYEPGRAHVIVFNWELTDTVAVDASNVLAPGSQFSVHRVGDLFGAPVLEGIYDGSPLAVPMTGGAYPQPIGLPDGIDPSETPGKQFDVFVLIGCGG